MGGRLQPRTDGEAVDRQRIKRGDHVFPKHHAQAGCHGGVPGAVARRSPGSRRPRCLCIRTCREESTSRGGFRAPKRISAAAVASARSAHPREEPPRWISAPIDAPHRFDLVGVAHEMQDGADPGARRGWALEQLGRAERRHADLRRRCGSGPGARPVQAARAASLRQRLGDRRRFRGTAAQLRTASNQHGLHLGRHDPASRRRSRRSRRSSVGPGGVPTFRVEAARPGMRPSTGRSRRRSSTTP